MGVGGGGGGWQYAVLSSFSLQTQVSSMMPAGANASGYLWGLRLLVRDALGAEATSTLCNSPPVNCSLAVRPNANLTTLSGLNAATVNALGAVARALNAKDSSKALAGILMLLTTIGNLPVGGGGGGGRRRRGRRLLAGLGLTNLDVISLRCGLVAPTLNQSVPDGPSLLLDPSAPLLIVSTSQNLDQLFATPSQVGPSPTPPPTPPHPHPATPLPVLVHHCAPKKLRPPLASACACAHSCGWGWGG